MTPPRRALDVIATILMITASIAVLMAVIGKRTEPGSGAAAGPPARQPLIVPIEPIQLVESAKLGPDSASTVVLIFSEFECPFCRRFALEVIPKFKTEYLETGRAQFVFRHFPLPNHRNAFAAAEAAECARRGNVFWEMHDLLFAQPEDTVLTSETLGDLAVRAGLERASFTACLRAGLARRDVERDEALARKLGITGTPAFVIGRRDGAALRATSIHRGVQSIERLGAAVEAALGTK